MSKYGARALSKMEYIMHEYKEDELKTNTGTKVTNHKQAIATGSTGARRSSGKASKK